MYMFLTICVQSVFLREIEEAFRYIIGATHCRLRKNHGTNAFRKQHITQLQTFNAYKDTTSFSDLFELN